MAQVNDLLQGRRFSEGIHSVLGFMNRMTYIKSMVDVTETEILDSTSRGGVWRADPFRLLSDHCSEEAVFSSLSIWIDRRSQFCWHQDCPALVLVRCPFRVVAVSMLFISQGQEGVGCRHGNVDLIVVSDNRR